MTNDLLPADAATKPASAAQLAYLTELLKVRDAAQLPAECERARFGLKLGMTLKSASELIDALINAPKSAKTGYVKKITAEPPTYAAYGWNKLPVDTVQTTEDPITGAFPGSTLAVSTDGTADGVIAYATQDAKGVVKIVTDATASISGFGKAAAGAAQAADQLAQTIAAPAFGYFKIGDSLYSWDVTGKDYAPTLRRLVKNPYAYGGEKKATWRKTHLAGGSTKVQMTYKPYGGNKGYAEKTTSVYVPNKLMGLTPLTKDEAAALGKELSFCIRCGAELSDPQSIAQGIGPVCITYWS